MEKESNETVVRRNKKGTSNKDLFKWPQQELDDIDCILAANIFIQQKIREDASKVDDILACPEDQEDDVWQYEQFRIICSELNKLVAMLAPVCECAVMCAPKSTTFLCAAHEPPKECDAMSYMNHTLDSAASVLTSERHFPSRVQIKPTSLRQIPSIARRVYRVLAHAYFLHREVYDEFESEHHVCERFHKLAVKYKLISQEQLVVPIDS
eukprot:m.22430 g.22430  ORF g.22430 m.22430 type:complete len:210 (+) comp7399_c0_seq3:120-749(+)